ncbi:hypothetical protein COBT_002902, partial [Conglomerata obtusa]
MQEIDIHRNSVSRFIRKAISVFNHINRDEMYGKLGKNLPGTIIEIDETHIGPRRDNRGRILRGEAIWIIGTKRREPKMIRLKIAKRRNKRICEKF